MSLEQKSEDLKCTYVPLPGTYVAFSLDLEKTLDLNGCDIDDEYTVQVVKEFACKQFGGYCVEYQELPYPTRKYHRIMVRPLQQGLMIPVPDYKIEPDMCGPVYPETSHPLSREPTHPNKPLPWSGCYHPTCMDVIVRFPTRVTDYSSAYRIPIGERVKFQRYMEEDNTRRFGECDFDILSSCNPSEVAKSDNGDYVSENKTRSEGSLPKDKDVKDDTCSSRRHYVSTCDSVHDTPAVDIDNEDRMSHCSDSGQLSDDDEDKELIEINPGNLLLALATMELDVKDDPQFIPVVKFTPDLPGVEELSSAYQLDLDLMELERLVKKCQEGPPMILPDTILEASGRSSQRSILRSRKHRRGPKFSSVLKSALRRAGKILSFKAMLSSLAQSLAWRPSK